MNIPAIHSSFRVAASCLLLGFCGGHLNAQREPLAVAPVTASPSLLESARASGEARALARVADAMDVRLGNALHASGKFEITGRRELPEILEEQSLAESGNLARDTAARAFELTGARYLLVVGIDDFQDYTERATFAQVDRDISRRQVRLSAVARIFDTTTGTLLVSTQVGRTESETREDFAAAQRHGDRTEELYTKLAEGAARDIAQDLTYALYPPRVVAKTGNQITINQGEGSGIQRGQRVSVYAVGEVMTDPDTGEALGREEVLLGEAVIININPRTAQARLSEDHGVERGHVVRTVD